MRPKDTYYLTRLRENIGCFAHSWCWFPDLVGAVGRLLVKDDELCWPLACRNCFDYQGHTISLAGTP